MKQRRGIRRGLEARRGSALVMSLIAVAGVLALATTFTQIASSVSNRQAQAAHRKQAFYMAEAGLAEGYAALMCGRSGAVGSSEAPARFGHGLFWVEANTDEDDPAVVHLESHGMVGSGQARLSVVARRNQTPVSALGLYSGGELVVPAGSTIDAYDSSVADYASTEDHGGAQVSASGAILLEGTEFQPTTIDGDVTPGLDQEVTDTPFVTVTGSTDAAFSETTLPAVEVPEIPLESAISQDSPYPYVIPSGRSGYASLTVAAGSQAIVQGPARIVLGSLTLEPEAELVFDTTGGAIALFLTGDLTLPAGSLVTVSGTDPADLMIQIATEQAEGAEPMLVEANASFHGVLYAPSATLQVGSNFEVFGALVADSVAFSGPASLHFDTNLGAAAAEAEIPESVSWWIIKMENSPNVGSSPFDLLGVDPSMLAEPSMALEDQLLDIDYYDASNVYHTYSGPESGFDWSLVKTVIVASRDGIAVQFPRAAQPKLGVPKSPGTLPVVDFPM